MFANDGFTGQSAEGPLNFRFSRPVAGGPGGEIYIYDDIGPSWWGMIDAEHVMGALREIGKGPVLLRINSRGGDVSEGVAIHNALERYGKARPENSVTVAIDALAASAASLIAMSGGAIEIAKNALMMIHNSWTIALGDSAELRQVSEILDKYDHTIAATYAARTELDEDTLRDMMAVETWMTAEEAVAHGFADNVGDATDATAPEMNAAWVKDGPDRAGDRVNRRLAGPPSHELLRRVCQLRRRRAAA